MTKERRRKAMREYEKKLGLDKAWDKMQSGGKAVNSFYTAFTAVIFYTVLYIVIRLIFGNVSMNLAWDNTAKLFTLWKINISISDLVFFLCGITVYIYGAIRLMTVSKAKQSAQGDNGTPAKLLTDGMYSKVRHPMYGVFAIMPFAILLPLRSYISFLASLFFIAFELFNAYFEEKRDLIPTFKDQYNDYRKKVKRVILLPWQITVMLLLTAGVLIGYII